MARFLLDVSPVREIPAFRRLWAGSTLSMLGSQFTVIAISLEVFELTHSTFAVGLVGVFALVPLIVAGLYGGSIGDAHDRRLAGLLTVPRLLPVAGPVGMRSTVLMTVALRVMGNLVTESDRDVVARAWRLAGRASLKLDHRPPFT